MNRARWLLVLWLVLGVVVWNGVFDAVVTSGVREYLFRQAAHDAGRGAPVAMREVMDRTIPDAALIASLWTLLIAGAGIGTVLLLTRIRIRNPESRIQKDAS
jgi:hypothetical protein